MASRPNILLILSDQHSWRTAGCYGSEAVQTPNLDRLAGGGVRFAQAYSTCPVCSPARATLQTGRYPHEHGVVHNDLDIDHGLPSLARSFHSAGYETCYVGKAHWIASEQPGFVAPDQRLGWKHWRGHNRGHFHYDTPDFDGQGRLTGRYRGRFDTDVQREQIYEFLEGPGAALPWLVQWNIALPHPETLIHRYRLPEVRAAMKRANHDLGFGFPDEVIDNMGKDNFAGEFPQQFVDRLLPGFFMALYRAEEMQPLPSVPEELRNMARYTMREYFAMISCLDDQIGRMVDYLEVTGRMRDTIIVYTSDHGEMMGAFGYLRLKNHPYQNALRVPMIGYGPDQVRQGAVVQAPTATIDVAATLLDLAGIAPLDGSHGVSQAAWFRGDNGPVQTDLYLGLNDWRALFDGRYLLVAYGEGDELRLKRLVDTAADPNDLHDLRETPEHGLRAQALFDRLLAKVQELDDRAWVNFAGEKKHG